MANPLDFCKYSERYLGPFYIWGSEGIERLSNSANTRQRVAEPGFEPGTSHCGGRTSHHWGRPPLGMTGLNKVFVDGIAFAQAGPSLSEGTAQPRVEAASRLYEHRP